MLAERMDAANAAFIVPATKGVSAMKLFTMIVILPLFALAFTGCTAARGTSPKGLEAPIEQAALSFSADVIEGRYRIVTTAELKKWLDEKRDMTIISTLSAVDDMKLGTIPGALNATMPVSGKVLSPEDTEHMLMAAGNDKELTLVVYCDFVACRRSHFGAKMLVDKGFRNVYRYPAGTTGWGEAGYPLVK